MCTTICQTYWPKTVGMACILNIRLQWESLIGLLLEVISVISFFWRTPTLGSDGWHHIWRRYKTSQALSTFKPSVNFVAGMSMCTSHPRSLQLSELDIKFPNKLLTIIMLEHSYFNQIYFNCSTWKILRKTKQLFCINLTSYRFYYAGKRVVSKAIKYETIVMLKCRDVDNVNDYKYRAFIHQIHKVIIGTPTWRLPFFKQWNCAADFLPNPFEYMTPVSRFTEITHFLGWPSSSHSNNITTFRLF